MYMKHKVYKKNCASKSNLDDTKYTKYIIQSLLNKVSFKSSILHLNQIVVLKTMNFTLNTELYIHMSSKSFVTPHMHASYLY